MRDVFFLTSGWFNAPAAVVGPPREAFPNFRKARLCNTVGVIIRDSGDVALVDSGWSREACAAPGRTLGQVQARVLGMDVKNGDAVVDQLARLGIARDRVKTIVATHLHLDHIGGASDFPDAEVVCSDVELSAARVRPASKGYRPADIEYARVRPVYLGSGPSYGFPAHHDLFGDGEVVLLDAHGHSPGLVAVALRARNLACCYVHIGDAAYQTWEWGLSPAGPSILSRIMGWRTDLMKQRYTSLRDCEADPRRPTLVPSHDAAVWETLPHAPAVPAP